MVKDIHIDTPKYTVQGVHRVQYDDTKYDSFIIYCIKSVEQFQICGSKEHTATTCDCYVNNMILR